MPVSICRAFSGAVKVRAVGGAALGGLVQMEIAARMQEYADKECMKDCRKE